MADQPLNPDSRSAPRGRAVLTSVRVEGYKSLLDVSLTVRPLTLLAGANSSGKSSMMQPLLLIKQTMDAPYQTAGALVLAGPHVQLSSADEALSRIPTAKKAVENAFRLTVTTQTKEENDTQLELTYQADQAGFRIIRQSTAYSAFKVALSPDMTWDEISTGLPEHLQKLFANAPGGVRILPNMAFLEAVSYDWEGTAVIGLRQGNRVNRCVADALHIGGLRGNPQRAYQIASLLSGQVQGTFEPYTAGLINRWQQQNDTAALAALTDALQRLGLTNTVEARVLNANEIEVKVGRLPVGARSRKNDLVNIADVGFGVSQVLPVVVALIAAEPGQLVYIEQPELHLHPRAQVQMAHLLADAARRGVRVVVETHSSLILLTVQTLVAEAQLAPADVALHWFERDAKGATKVTLAEVDANGAYGPWPEDFGDVELTAQGDYLDAVARRHAANPAEAQ